MRLKTQIVFPSSNPERKICRLNIRLYTKGKKVVNLSFPSSYHHHSISFSGENMLWILECLMFLCVCARSKNVMKQVKKEELSGIYIFFDKSLWGMSFFLPGYLPWLRMHVYKHKYFGWTTWNFPEVGKPFQHTLFFYTHDYFTLLSLSLTRIYFFSLASPLSLFPRLTLHYYDFPSEEQTFSTSHK